MKELYAWVELAYKKNNKYLSYIKDLKKYMSIFDDFELDLEKDFSYEVKSDIFLNPEQCFIVETWFS